MNSLQQSLLDRILEAVPQDIQDYIKLYPAQQCFLAGGSLRDLLTGETPEDWDLFIYGIDIKSSTAALPITDIIHDEKAESIEEIIETFHVDCVKLALFWNGDKWHLQTPLDEALMTGLLNQKVIGKVYTTSYASTILIKVLTMIQKGWAIEPDQFSRLMIRVILESKEGADQITDRLALLASLTNVFKETKKRGISAYSKIFWDSTESKREAFKTNNPRPARPVRTIERSGTRVVAREDYVGGTPTEATTTQDPPRTLGRSRCPYGTPGCPSTDTQCNATDPRRCPCYRTHSPECQSTNFQPRPASTISYQDQVSPGAAVSQQSISDGVLPLPTGPSLRNLTFNPMPQYTNWANRVFEEARAVVRDSGAQSTSQPRQRHSSSQAATSRPAVQRATIQSIFDEYGNSRFNLSNVGRLYNESDPYFEAEMDNPTVSWNSEEVLEI